MNNKKIIIISSIVAVLLAIIVIFIFTNKPTYTIKFETNGGDLIEEQLVKKGEKVVQPHDPQKEGYAFTEWVFQGKPYDFSQEVTANLTLEAKWIKIETNTEKIIVKFNTDGGTTISNQILEKGDIVVKPSDPTKKGYKFVGWTLNEKPYDFNTPVNEKIELKAKWEKLKEENNNSTSNRLNSGNNSNTNNNNGNNTTTKPTTPSKPTSKKYTITFNSNGGTPVAPQTITEGGKVYRPQDPTRTGYTFAGWTLNGSVYDFNAAVKGNLTLTAKWEKVEEETPTVKKYKIIFDPGLGASYRPENQIVVENYRVTRPQDPRMEGYTFVEWTYNGSAYNFDEPVKRDMVLTAKWTLAKYEVHFYTDGGSEVQSQLVTNGSKAIRPKDPTKDGYDFAGWVLGDKIYDFDTPVTINIYIRAKWIQKTSQ